LKVIDRIDLTTQPSGCSQHPLVKLKNLIDKLGVGEAIEVITNADIIPIETLEIIATRKNLDIMLMERDGSTYRLVLIKK